MTNPTLQFRPAQPSDAPIAARLIYDAAPEQYDFFFDIDRPTILDFLGKVFRKRSGVFGYQRYTVATLDEKVVAIGAFYDSAHRPKADLKTLWTLITCFDPVRLVGILGRISKLSELLTHNEEKTEHIANFAVIESLRGQGIGNAFLQRQIQLAREKGQKQCSLYVASSNPNAQRLYERLGFQVIGEVTLRGVPVHNRPPSLRQMELKL